MDNENKELVWDEQRKKELREVWGNPIEGERFFWDGIVNPEHFDASDSARIMFFLKEGYGEKKTGQEGGIHPLEEDLVPHFRAGGPGARTWSVGTKWLLGLQHVLKTGEILPYEKVMEYYYSVEDFRIKQMNHMAGINANKIGSESARSNDSRVARLAKKDKEKLKWQINTINPSLIVLCSDVVKRVYQTSLFPEELQEGKGDWHAEHGKVEGWITSDGRLIVGTYHPNARKKHIDMYTDLMIVTKKLMNQSEKLQPALAHLSTSQFIELFE